MPESETPQPRSTDRRPTAEIGATAALAGAPALGGDGDAVTIARPAPGQTQVIDVASAKAVAFNFSMDDCRVTFLDVDAVLTFADGGRLVLPSLVMRILTADPPQLKFAGVTTDHHEMLVAAGDVGVVNQMPQLAISEQSRAPGTGQEPEQPVQVVQLPATQRFVAASAAPPAERPVVNAGGGDGLSLQDSNGRYAKKVNFDEQQSSSLKAEGAITQQTDKTQASEEPKVEAVNGVPVIQSDGGGDKAQLQVLENRTLVTTVLAKDFDGPSDVTYAVIGGRDAHLFSVNGRDGRLYFIGSPDFEQPASAAGTNVYEVVVEASDGGDADQQELTITVGNVNETPTAMVLTTGSIGEDAARGSVLGQVIGSDPDAGDVLRYSFAPSGDAGGRFAIDAATGVVTVARPELLDYETAPRQEIVVRATDAGGLVLDTRFDVSILDRNDAPVITSDGGGATATVAIAERGSTVTRVQASDTDPGDTVTYRIAGGPDGAAFTINTATGAITLVPGPDFEQPVDADRNGVFEIIVEAVDSRGGVDRQTLFVGVTDVNEKPVGISIDNRTVFENSPAGTLVGTVAGQDPDSGDPLTYSFVIGGDAGGRFLIDAVTGALTVAPAANLDTETNPSHVVIVRATDAGGLSTEAAFTIAVADVNEAPEITSMGGGSAAAVSLSEGTTVAGVVIAQDPERTTITYRIVGGADASRFVIDPQDGVLTIVSRADFETPTDANGDNVFEIDVEASDGALTDTQSIRFTIANVNEPPRIVSNGAGASALVSMDENAAIITTVQAVDPDSGGSLVYAIVGGPDAPLFSINSVDGLLYFVTPPDFEQSRSIGAPNEYRVTVQVSDGIDVDEQQLTIRVENANEAPTNAVLINSTVVENPVTGAPVGRVIGSDQDAGSILAYMFAPGGDAGGRFRIDGQTGDITVGRGDLIDFEANQTHFVVVRVTDQGGLFLDKQIAVTVLNANDPPVITSNAGAPAASLTVTENTRAVTTISATDQDAGDSITYRIVGGTDAGRFSVDAATGAVVFNALPNFELPTDLGADNVYEVIVEAVDGTGGFDRQTLTVTVADVNEAPDALTLSPATIVENAANGAVIGTARATDQDGGGAVTYAFVPGADAAGRFVIDAATGIVSVVDGSRLDYETGPTQIVVIRATDQLGLFVDKTFAISVTDVNETPVITSAGGGANATVLMAENVASVGTVTAFDPDLNTSLRYSLTGGADAALFSIDAVSGSLRFVSPANFEAPTDAGQDNTYEVVVQVSDGFLVDTQAIQVMVANANEAPLIQSNGAGPTAAVTVAENSTGITTVAASDQDLGATLSYAIIGGADAGRFAIDRDTGVLTFVVAPDREAPADAGVDNVYDVVVEVSDGLLVDTQAIAITVANVNETPVIVSNGGGTTAALSIAEGVTSVTTVSGNDPDAGTTLVYSIVAGGDGGRFVIDSATGVLRFAATPNFEAPVDQNGDNVYAVTVQTSDGSLSVQQTLAITVINVNEAPAITSNGGGASASVAMAENGAAVTTVTATDPDAGTAIAYAIIGGADAALFAIDQNSGVLHFVGAPNFEVPLDAGADNVYDVIVQASDGQLTTTQVLAVTVTNQNEAPSITSNGGAATAAIPVSENVTAVTTVSATDPDAGTTLTYSIAGGVDAGRFLIDANTGVLRFAAVPNFEAPADSNDDNLYNVTVQVSDGSLATTQAIAVTVGNLNETPVITSNGGGGSAAVSIAENGSAVTVVTASDPDGGTSLAYSIIGGADMALFTIDTVSGVLRFAASPNYEVKADSGANNVYDVVVQASDGVLAATQSLAVTVTNVNEAPSIVSNGAAPSAAITLAENLTAVTTVVGVDPDAGTTLAYAIVGGVDSSRFVIDGTTGALSFVTAPNFEAPTDSGANNVYDVQVQASDGSLVVTQTIAVTVVNGNETPTITSNGGLATAAVLRAENGTAVTTVTATDPDAIAPLTYSISGGEDAAHFVIDPNSGVLTFAAPPNFEAPSDFGGNNVYDVIVQVSDGELTDTQQLSVTVTNLNEAPAITSNGGGPTASLGVAENGTAVTTVTASDPDAGTTLTYSIVGGADAGRFSIGSSTGVLTFVAPPDFESPTDAGANNVYDVQVR
ncbi:MAG: cadherin domain-containing protein, partial [Alsobacter sp.]